MKGPLFFCIILCLYWSIFPVSTGFKESSQQRLLAHLFAKYDGDGRPSSDRSRAVLVSFGAKLVRIIQLNERGNTIRSQWWIYQQWMNSDLTWNEADYNGTKVIHVSPRKVWAPDIILYNSADDNDKLGGGTEKYKTKIAINSNGSCKWMAPAIFQSTCEINTKYFPFDDQICTLKFGSWAFDGSELDVVVDESETGAKGDIYRNNTEWDLVKVTAVRIEELTSAKLPADSEYIPLLAKYYSSAIFEIGLALFATCVILNFFYQRCEMPGWLKQLMFSFLGPLVRIKYTPQPSNKTRKKNQKGLIEENFDLASQSEGSYSGPIELRKMTVLNDSTCEGNGRCGEAKPSSPVHLIRSRTRSSIRETPILNDQVTEKQQGKYVFEAADGSRADEINNITDWQMAAKILDRVVLVLGILISVATFLAIFMQAPRVQEMFS